MLFIAIEARPVLDWARTGGFMRKLVLILLALIAVATFIRAYGGPAAEAEGGMVKASLESASRQ